MEQYKKFLVGAATVALLVFAYAALSYVKTYAGASAGTSGRTFSVTGTGKIVTSPDVAVFNFSIVDQGGTNIEQTKETNDKKSNAVVKYLKDQGVKAEDIQTQYYSIQPRYQSFDCSVPAIMMAPDGGGTVSSVRPCPPSSIVGYTIEQNYTVKLRDFSKIGSILSGTVTAGANTVSQLSFQIDDIVEKQAEAKGQAIKQGMDAAKKVADAGGFRLGRLVSVEDAGFGPMPYQTFGMGGAVAKDMAVSAPSIEPGSQEVNSTVVLRYEIK